MNRYVVALGDTGRTQLALVGGKGANLGELARLPGVVVPPGFCITTDALAEVLRAIGGQSAAIREILATLEMPSLLREEITAALNHFGTQHAYAVRSSAGTEDLPTASSAGQHDSFLDVVGVEAVLEAVKRCWASLFSERAVSYRLRHGLDVRAVSMAVVVQRMVKPDAAGVLFTADPVSGHRGVAVVEAVRGLGESLVSGRVRPDRYVLRGDAVESVESVDTVAPILTPDQAATLVSVGRRIERHFGCPQDIEWCLADGQFQVVQSRAITTLFPVPARTDTANHVYLSVGHQQMMTDPMAPLGLSFWQLTTPRPMQIAGGRLFVDVTSHLATSTGRAAFLHMIGESDPLFRSALQRVLDRPDFLPPATDADIPAPTHPAGLPVSPPPAADPSIVTQLIRRNEASVAQLERAIVGRTGPALIDFILEDIQELRRLLFDPESLRVIMAAIDASAWLNDRMERWLGERKAADSLTRSAPGNITSEMGLALLDVADVIRPHAAVIALLESARDARFLADLPSVSGGASVRAAIAQWLDHYGMRGVGEIDISRPRWHDRPELLLPLLLAHVHHAAPGEATRRFVAGEQLAARTTRALLERVRALPDGAAKAAETQEKIDLVRTFIGYREYPKYGMICRYAIYRKALLAEGSRLAEAGVLHERDDLFHLTVQELQEVLRTQRLDHAMLEERKAVHRWHATLSPPRVLTSDGEAIQGAYHHAGVPPGALAGLAVSAGVVEGRARVLHTVSDARLEPGDILVTAYTDPSWTPLFVAASGLVTEVGGLMTHGAVVAREYGLPALVGVDQATTRIRDGQRIRVHGTDGYVECLDE